jgi:hypothetical protein
LKSFYLVQYNRTGLHYAAENGMKDTAIMLLGKGASIDARDKVSIFNNGFYFRFKVIHSPYFFPAHLLLIFTQNLE